MIMNGTLVKGDALPSVRALAKELRISIITTKRAYDDLESEGFITTFPGKGSYISGINQEYIREESLKQIENELSAICDKAIVNNISKNELIELINVLYNS